MPPRFRQLLLAAGLVLGQSLHHGRAEPVYAWRTLTGRSGGTGNSDGPGATARFWYPSGVAADSLGNLFVADTYNNSIRQVATNGLVTTLAGSPGQAGNTDGAGGAARFSSPAGVALDTGGNLFVADSLNHTIRRVTRDGLVTTFVGKPGQSGSADGVGAAARFNQPWGLAVDRAGLLYVADAGNNTLRLVTTNGMVTTLAGNPGQSGSADGTGPAAQFDFPSGLAVDSAGNVYVADLNNSTIRVVSGSGVVATLAGTAGEPGSLDGTGSAASFFFPSSLTLGSGGALFVADTYNQTIRKVTTNGVVTTLAGAAGESGALDGTNDVARFNDPAGVAADGADNLLVADTGNSLIRKVTSGGTVTTLAGSIALSGSSDAAGSLARFNMPYGLAAVGAGTLYVADTANHTIRKVTGAGLVQTLAGTPGLAGTNNGTGAAARFNQPYNVTTDHAGNLYVTDWGNNTIRKVTIAGEVTTLAGLPGQPGSADGTNSAARFSKPFGVVADSNGDLYVTDSGNHTIRRVTQAGAVTTLAGSPGQKGSADGTNGVARFSSPAGITLDRFGNLFVADAGNNTLREVTSTGSVTTLAGSPGQSGSFDGTNGTARFFAPAGMACDAAGNLYVAEVGNSVIRRVTSDGVVTTLAGSPGQPGSADGVGNGARFFYPFGVAVDSTGDLYVADAGNDTIRKVTSDGTVTTLAGSPGQSGSADVAAGIERYFQPSAVAVDTNGNLYVADTYNSTIRKVFKGGGVVTLAGAAGQTGSADATGPSAHFSFPYGVAVDLAGNAYVADTYNNTIRKVTSGGTVTTLAGAAGTVGASDGVGSAASFASPAGIGVDAAQNVYVADSFNNTIRKVTRDGLVTTLAGSPGQAGSTDGIGGAARFSTPNGVAVDTAGNVYVADSANFTIRKVTGGGVVTTLAGSPGQAGSRDGVAGDARFDYPFSVAVDGLGNVYVADSGNSTIRQVTSDGVVRTLGGLAGVIGGTDGIGPSATFAGPTGIALDRQGRLYVADAGNNRICLGLLVPPLTISADSSGVNISWPSPSTGFSLQTNSALSAPAGWSVFGGAVADDGTNKSLTVGSPTANQFFRLIAD